VRHRPAGAHEQYRRYRVPHRAPRGAVRFPRLPRATTPNRITARPWTPCVT